MLDTRREAGTQLYIVQQTAWHREKSGNTVSIVLDDPKQGHYSSCESNFDSEIISF